MAKPKQTTSANIGFEEKLFTMADKLCNNMDAAEYKHVVLGLGIRSTSRKLCLGATFCPSSQAQWDGRFCFSQWLYVIHFSFGFFPETKQIPDSKIEREKHCLSMPARWEP